MSWFVICLFGTSHFKFFFIYLLTVMDIKNVDRNVRKSVSHIIFFQSDNKSNLFLLMKLFKGQAIKFHDKSQSNWFIFSITRTKSRHNLISCIKGSPTYHDKNYPACFTSEALDWNFALDHVVQNPVNRWQSWRFHPLSPYYIRAATNTQYWILRTTN